MSAVTIQIIENNNQITVDEFPTSLTLPADVLNTIQILDVGNTLTPINVINTITPVDEPAVNLSVTTIENVVQTNITTNSVSVTQADVIVEVVAEGVQNILETHNYTVEVLAGGFGGDGITISNINTLAARYDMDFVNTITNSRFKQALEGWQFSGDSGLRLNRDELEVPENCPYQYVARFGTQYAKYVGRRLPIIKGETLYAEVMCATSSGTAPDLSLKINYYDNDNTLLGTQTIATRSASVSWARIKGEATPSASPTYDAVTQAELVLEIATANNTYASAKRWYFTNARMLSGASAEGANARITVEAVTRADADTVLAGLITTISTEVDGALATITEFAESVDGIMAQWGVQVNVGGVITGLIKLSADEDYSVVKIQADKFIISNEAGTEGDSPFEITGGITYIKEAVIPTLTVDKLLVANFGSNLIINPDAEDNLGGWRINARATSTSLVFSRDTGSSNSGDASFKIADNSTHGTMVGAKAIAVKAGEILAWSLWARGSGSSTNGLYIRVHELTSKPTSGYVGSTANSLTGIDNATSTTDLITASSAIPNTWTYYDGTYTVPSGVKYVSFSVGNWTASTVDLNFDDVRFRRQLQAIVIEDGTITGAKIAAATIAGSNIINSTITGGKIAGTTITAANIVGGTITGTEIASATITNGNIVNSTITGGKIAANTITAANITAGTITATEIAANTITAAQIAAGTITATEIAADSITVDKLVVANFGSNLIINPDAEENLAGWRIVARATTTSLAFTRDTTTVNGGTASFKLADNSTHGSFAGSRAFAVKAGQILAWSVWINGSGASAAGLYIRMYELTSAPSTRFVGSTSNSLTSVDASTSTTELITADSAIPNTWTYYEGTYTVPAGVKYATFAIGNWTASTVDLYFDDVRVRRQIDAVTIEDGVITNAKLVNATITGAKIANTTIAASNIVNSTITATQIANSTITATQIANSTITGGKIAGTTITASNIVNGTITATQISDATITNAKIVDATITGAKIAANTITASNIAAGTITASEIAADSITVDQLNIVNFGSNLIANPDAEIDVARWRIIARATTTSLVFTRDTTQQNSGEASFKIADNSTHGSVLGARAIAVKPGWILSWSVWIKGSSASAAGLYIRMYELTSAPTTKFVGSTLNSLTGVDNNTSVTELITGDSAISNSWTYYSGTYTVPASVKYISFGIGNWTASTADLYFDDVRVRRQLDTITFEDGAVTGGKIASATITASNITNSTITATQIANSTITGGKIAGTTITASNITAATITATEIANSTITATQISNSTITGGKIAGTTITASNITNATITTTQIAASTITGGNIAGTTITASNIVAATITASEIANSTITGGKIAGTTITASNIANSTITTTQIANSTITGGNIAGTTISASNIVSSTITATQIANSTITGGKIANATITGANIAGATITDSNIVGGTITGASIAAGTITASNIAAGTITATEIAADSITVDQLTIANFGSNLISNPDAEENLARWKAVARATTTSLVLSRDTTQQLSGIASFKIADNSTHGTMYGARAIAVKPGWILSWSVWIKGSASSTNGLYIRMHEITSAPSTKFVGSTLNSLTGIDAATSTTDLVTADSAIPNTWTYYSGTYTVPAGVIYVTFSVGNWTASTADLYFDDVRVRRQLDTIVFEDGSVTGLKIAGTTITASNIANSTITATQILNSTITGGKIANTTITASNIVAATITASEIANSTITGGKIAGTTITASNIAAATITASEIANSTITGSKIAGTTITASNIFGGTITATEIANSTITGGKIAGTTITASNIVNATITTTQIANSTITGGNIAGTTISASNIVSSTITATQIANSTITGGKIANATITGANIAGGTITDSNILGGTITGASIAANTITASNIAAGTITASEIAADSITVDQLTIADYGSNLIRNPDAEANIAGWRAVARATTTSLVLSRDTTQQNTGTASFKIADNSTHGTMYGARAFSVKAGWILAWSVWVKGSAASTNGLYIRMHELTSKPATNFVGSTLNSLTNIDNATSTMDLVTADSAISNSWTYYSGSYTVPAGVQYVTFSVGNWTASTADLYFDDVRVRRLLDTITFEDGAVTGGKIASATITASNITNSTITATQIANSTITGAKIAGTTITASNIVNATITTTQIASSTITGSNIAGTTITASNIANTTITASQIANSTITATQISNSTITGGKIAGTTITASNIVAGTITGTEIASATIAASNIINSTITGGKIASATITGSNIAGGTITDSNILGGTITGASIAAGTITASNISAGTITASEIAADSITVDQLNFVNFGSNLIANSDAETNIAGWRAVQRATTTSLVLSRDVTQQNNGAASFKIADNSTHGTMYGARAIAVKPGWVLAWSVWIKGSSASAAGLYIRMQELTSAPTTRFVGSTGNSLTNVDNATSTTDLVTASSAIPSSWTYYSGNYTVPAGVLYITFSVGNWTASTADLYFDDVRVRRQLDTLTFEDGAITGGKIANVTITAANITSGTITATEIANSTITGGKIAGTTITASNIQNATITTTQIANSTITGGNIAGTTITASNIANTTITASQIANSTITATQISNSTITGGKIAGTTITASNIVAGTITATEILNSTITGGKIAAATITGSNIAGSTITDSNILGGTITGASIAAGTITAANIAAGTITASEIAADSITVDQLNIVNFGSNLISNPDAEDNLARWRAVARATTTSLVLTRDTTQQNSGEASFKIADNSTHGTVYGARAIAVKAGWILSWSVWVKGSSASTNGLYIRMYELTSAPTTKFVGSTLNSLPNVDNATSTTDLTTANGAVPSSWTYYSGTYTVPASVKYITFGVGIWTASTADLYFDDVRVRRQLDTITFEDGAVTGGKIASATITASNITGGTITATEIANSTITGGKIAGTTITASNIVNATITTTQIANSTITGGNIAGTTITASNIANTTITASQIANSTITATQITNSTITGGKIANTTITGANIVNATITATQIQANTITATEIAAATITATEIAASTITGAKIAATTIAAGNIVSGTITTTQIAATTIVAGNIASSTITATQIAASTITGAKIAANTITASNIAAGTITATEIAAGTITAANISAGSITANEIAVDSITVDKLTFVNFSSNLIRNPDAEVDLADWTETHRSGSALVLSRDTTNQNSGAASFKITDNGANGSFYGARAFAVKAGEKLAWSIWIDGSSASANGLYIRMIEKNAKPTARYLGQSALTDVDNAYTSTTDLITGNSAIPSSWTYYSGTYTVPAGIKYVTFSVANWTASTADLYFDDVRVRRVLDTITIDDDAITNAKILASTITGAKIAGTTIAASNIVSATITTTQIANSTITGSNIAGTTITASNIANSTITGGKIANTTITASNIVGGTITNAEIASATILDANITASTITGSKIANTTIAAGNIVNSTITATQIANSTITGGKIANTTITASNIVGGTITGTELANTTITNSHIVNSTITGGKIAANTITAANITAGTITATEIAANTITSAQIAAGTITATEIAADSITVDKLVVANFGSNLIINPDAEENLAAWRIVQRATTTSLVFTRDTGNQNGGAASFKLADNSTHGSFAGSRAFAVKPGWILAWSVWIDGSGASTNGLYIRMFELTSAPATRFIGSTANSLTGVDAATSTTDLITADSAIPATWTYYEGTYTVPAGVKYVTFAVGNYTASTADLYFDDVRVRRQIDAVTIEDGVITNAKIVNATITGGKIANATIAAGNIVNSTITATQIANSTITGGKIAGTTITASNIVAGTITGTEIASATITGSNIAGTTITASNIQNSTITSTQIANSTITATQIANSTITGGKIANTTITASNIQGGTITGTEIASATIANSNIVNSTITGGKIAANTITAANITAGTITATEIAANTITSAQIAAGTITATEIAADSITVDKLVVANFGSNLILNPDAEENLAGWRIVARATTTSLAFTRDTTTVNGGSASFRLTDNSTHGSFAGSRAFAVKAGQILAWSAWINGSSASAAGLHIRMYELTSAPSTRFVGSTSNSLANVDASTSTTDLITASSAIPNTWTYYEGTYTVPAGVKYVTFAIGNWTASTADLYFDDVRVRRQIDAVTIEDGVITNAKLVNATITGAKIAGTTIAASNIVNSTITGGKIAGTTITASNIAGGTITNAEIASATILDANITASTITGSKIAGTTITASNIQNSTITATQISNSTITGGKIANTTITASNIVGGTITGVEIANATITGANIAANTITAANIVAGTITASEIAADSITVDKLTMVNFGSNLIRNSDAEVDTSDWRVVHRATTTSLVLTRDVTQAKTGEASFKIADNSTHGSVFGSRAVPVSEGEILAWSVWIKGSAADADGLYINVYELNAKPSTKYIGNTANSLTGIDNATSTTNLANNTAIPNTWTYYSGNYTVPAGIKYVTFGVGLWTGGVADLYFDDARLRRLISTITIDDGAIVDAKIASTTITGSKISNSTITGGKIANTTITASNIVGGTITNAEIASATILDANITASTITGSKIANSTITGGKIAGTTITASNIAGGTITNAEIASATILAANITNSTITGGKIANTTITGANIVNATITATQIAAGTITAAQIAANTITASQIAAGTITATQIASGTITATQIAAGTITANELSVGAITASRIVTPGGNNYILDADWSDTSYWALGSGWTVDTSSTDVTTALNVSAGLKTPSGNGTTSQALTRTLITNTANYFPVDPSKKYLVKTSLFRKNGFTGFPRLEVFWYKANKTTAASTTSTLTIGFDNRTTAVSGGDQTSIGYSEVFTAPSDAAYARMSFRIDWSTTLNNAQYATFGAPSFKAMIDPDLIDDVLITGAMIDDNTIGGIKLINNTITATQIANGTITATQIQAATITATEIANTTITGGKIANNTITATQIANNAVWPSLLLSSDHANLIADPSFTDNVYWTFASNWAQDSSADTTTTLNLDFALKSPTGNGTTSQATSDTRVSAANYPRVEPSASYRINFRVFVKSGFTGLARAVITWYKQDKVTGATVNSTIFAITDYRTVARVGDTTETYDSIVTVSADAAFGRLRFETVWSTTLNNAQYVVFADPRWRRAVTSELIVDGSIVAADIANTTITATQIANTTITGGKLVNNTITATQIQAATITTTEIAATTIVAGNIAANTITATQIAAATITATELVNSTVTGAKIANTTVAAGNIVSSTITATQIANTTITGAKMVNNTVTATQINAATITTTEIASLTIVAGNIANTTITGGKLANATITTTQIAASTIAGSNIAATTIAAGNIVSGTITTTQIAASTITGSNIAATTIAAGNIVSSTITATQIANTTITGAKMVNNTVTATQIAAATITATEIANSTITGGKIANNTITAANIAAGTITSAEVSTSILTSADYKGVDNAYNLEANFQGNLVASGIPTGWADWSAGAANTTRVTGCVSKYAAQIAAAAAAANVGILQHLTDTAGAAPMYPGWYRIVGDITLGAGSLTAAGILTQWRLTGLGTVQESWSINFATDADIAGTVHGAGTVGRRYQFAKTFQVTTSTVRSVTLYAMAHWSTFGSTAGAATIIFNRCALERVSDAEVISMTIPANIVAGTITSAEITNGTITGSDIAATTIAAGNIVSSTITATQIASTTITATQIANSTITGGKIANNTITAANIAAGTITGTEISSSASLTVGSVTVDGGTSGDAIISGSNIEIGNGRSVDGYAYLDLKGDTTYSDYGLRLIRGNTGANANSELIHRGTGELRLYTSEASVIKLYTAGVSRITVGAAGGVTIDSLTLTSGLTGSNIAATTITASNIVNSTITGTQIAATTIAAGNIVSSTITATQIANTTITGGKLVNNTITATQIQAATITTTEIAATTIVAGNIANSTITGGKIANTTITAANITAGTITTTEIASTTIVAGNIANSTITGGKIASTTITAANITASTITATEIANTTITGGKIAATTITGSNLVNGTITATQIAALAITASKHVIKDFNNYIADPLYTDSTYWTFGSGWTLDTSTNCTTTLNVPSGAKTPSGNGTTSQTTTETNQAATDSYVWIEPGKPLRVAARAFVKSGFTGLIRIIISWLKQDKSTSASTASDTFTIGSDYRTVAAGADTTASLDTRITAPSDAVWARYRCQVVWSTTLNNAQYAIFAAPRFERGVTDELSGDSYLLTATAANANTTVSVPAGFAVYGNIFVDNTTAAAVTGGVKIGTTNGGTQVVVAQAVAANDLIHITDANIVKRIFSKSASQTLFIQAVTAWNGCTVNFSIPIRKVF